MTSWVREMNPNDYERDDHERLVLMPRSMYERLDAYETSTPTAPSAGRVYRRSYRQGDGSGHEYVFFVEDAPASDPAGTQLHHPYRVLFADERANPQDTTEGES